MMSSIAKSIPLLKNLRNHRHVTTMEGPTSQLFPTQLICDTWTYSRRLGRDSSGLKHSKLKVKQVLKVSNKELRKQYNDHRMVGTGQRTIKLPAELQQSPALTSKISSAISQHDKCPELNLPETCLGPVCNEVYLFHGTKLDNIPSILEKGFDLNKARGGLYGKGMYLAESSEKADQYCGRSRNINSIF